MKRRISQLIRAFKGRLVGTSRMKRLVCETVLLMPPKVINYVVQHCWFLSSTSDAWAYTFHGDDVPNQHLIFLSDELLSQREDQIQYTLAHEIGHVILGHRNSINYKQSRREVEKQEKEADNFAQNFVKLEKSHLSKKMCWSI